MATLNASNITGSSGQSASSTRAAATDSGSRGRLTLRIRDLASFVRDHGDVAGDWLLVSGIKWRLLASMWDGFIATRLEGRHCDNSRWHSKCRYRMRLCNTSGRHETREAFQLFDAASNGWGFRWMHGPKLLADNTGFVVNNTATFDCEVTTFSCYVTDGAYGVRTRFHDVSFKFNKLDRIVFLYANKGFLAANANFFEAMFYGEFSDKNKEEVDLSGVDSDDFAWFLKAISPNPPDIQENIHYSLLRLASQFQSDKLIERIGRLLLDDEDIRRRHSFVSRLRIFDELQLASFRDAIIATATRRDIEEVVREAYEDHFSGSTWFKLILKYKVLVA